MLYNTIVNSINIMLTGGRGVARAIYRRSAPSAAVQPGPAAPGETARKTAVLAFAVALELKLEEREEVQSY